MTTVLVSPSKFVEFMAEIGLPTLGGSIKLNQYLCKIIAFGGAVTAHNLLGQLRYLKDDSTLWGNDRLSKATRHFDLVPKGQGYPSDFAVIWNFMLLNLPAVRKLKVQTSTYKAGVEVLGKVLDLAVVFREGRPFADGMAELIDNKCFGWDCIGFVSQYLVAIGHLTEYPSWTPKNFLKTLAGDANKKKFTPIDSLAEIAPLCVVTFGDAHIVIIDSVQSIRVESQKPFRMTATVTVCQSYTGGPHTRKQCTISQFGNEQTTLRNFTQVGIIDAFGAKCQIGKNADLSASYPNAMPGTDKVPDFVPGVLDDAGGGVPRFTPGVR